MWVKMSMAEFNGFVPYVNNISGAYNTILAERFIMVTPQITRVSDVLDTAFIALDENTLVAEAAKALYSQERCTIVVTHLDRASGQRAPIGIITERDIIFRVVAQNRGPFKVTLKDIMSTPIITIDADKSIDEAISIFNKHKINRLPVIHDSSIIGLLTAGMIISKVPTEKHSEAEL
jgi:signal-transduction protein with cAMP-binding, CBS, and nucleotidyltransferase domain